jgi:hypothetical protein
MLRAVVDRDGAKAMGRYMKTLFHLHHFLPNFAKNSTLSA